MRFFILAVMLTCLISCNGFEHMHYRKLKKVPATGSVEAPAFRERIIQARPETYPQDTVLPPLPGKNAGTSPVVSSRKSILYNKHGYELPLPIVSRYKSILYSKHGYKLPALVKKESRKPGKIGKNKKIPVKKIRVQRHGDGSVLLILLFLLLGFWLLITGIVMVVVGINAIIWWLILLGIVVAFLGIVPFLGIISLMLGDRYRPVPAYNEPQKTSAFPDHQ